MDLGKVRYRVRSVLMAMGHDQAIDIGEAEDMIIEIIKKALKGQYEPMPRLPRSYYED